MAFTGSTTMRTSDARRSCVVPRRPCAVSSRNRHTRHRAALLAVAWMLPGVWCVAHVLAHEIESSHHELELALSASFGLPAMSCDHGHAHSHPEAPPVLSGERVKKLAALVLVTAAVEIEGSRATLHSDEDTALGHASLGAAAALGPRAPPIS